MNRADIFKKKFEIIQQLTSTIVITDNIKTIADLLLELAINYANAEKGSLMLLTERNDLSILASKGLEPQFFQNYKIEMGQGIAGTVAKNRTPILVKNIEKDENLKNLRRDHYKTKSFISCPIISKNKLLGILNINDKKDGTPFNVDEFELAKILANQAAIALENALLLNQLKSKAAELEDINKKLIETDIIKTEFLTRISHELRTPLNSVKGAIYVLQQTGPLAQKEQQEFKGIISAEIDNLIAVVENLLSFLRLEDESRIIKKKVLNIGDLFRELKDSKTIKTMLARRGIHLTVESQDSSLEIIGDKIKVLQLFTNLIDGITYYLERGDNMNIRADENGHVNINITVSRALPEHVTPILDDARYIFQIEHPQDQLKLYLAKNIAETHRWKLSVRNSDGTGCIRINIPKSTKETVDIYMDQSMDLFVQFISELLDLDICSIMLNDDLAGELTVKSAVGLDDEIVKKTRIKLGDKIAGWVALEGKPVFIEDIECDPRFSKKSISQYTTKSLMSLPLKIGDRVIGVLNLNNKKASKPFTERDYVTASLLGEKISHFINILHSGNFQEAEMKQFIASLSSIFATGQGYQTKQDLLPELTDKILKSSKSLQKIKNNRQP